MSRITFLDNARSGENNIWRYIFTIILTWGTPIVFQLIIIIYAMSFLIHQGADMENLISTLTYNPLVLIALVGVTSIVSIIFLYIGVRYIHQRRFISLVSTDSLFNWKKLLKGGGIWFAILTASTLLSILFDPSGLEFSFNPNTFILLLVLSLLVFPVQASFEELFFRGYLMQGFGLLSRKPVVPLIITSVIFSLLHYFNGSYTLLSVDIVLQVFVLGLTLGIITLGENRLETAMGVHISNNIFASLIVNSPDNFGSNMPSIFTNTSPPDPLFNTLGMVVYALVLLLIIFWGKKENLIRIFRSGQ
ncbi:MAG TPA: type II CAAX endopeptidase family protein [Methanobacterium sp.]|nr:type II CAAX endopeptidase family protein [Methanobacterium sp.]